MTEEDDYHKYVIREGRFIGAFEEMYKHCKDPWRQDSTQHLAEDIALTLISPGTGLRVLDIGCGKGRLSERIRQRTDGRVDAIDVSATAVAHAQERYPHVHFRAAKVPPLPFANQIFDLVVCAELFWYVLTQLGELFDEVRRVLRPQGRFLVIQQFYGPGKQKYGTQTMEVPADLVAKIPLHLLQWIEVDRQADPKFVGLFEAQ